MGLLDTGPAGGRGSPRIFLISRTTVILLLLAAAGLLVWAGMSVGPDSNTATLVLDLAAEVLGIIITVAVVEWFLERRRMQNKALQIARTALHNIEHAVWVWQGGPREVEVDQLLGILSAVRPDDPLPDFTQNLLLNLGLRAKQALKNDPEVVDIAPGLMGGLEELSRLASIREGGALAPSEKIARILNGAVEELARALGLPAEQFPANLIRYRDPSIEGQRERQFGVKTDAGRGTGPLTSPILDSF